MRTFSLEKYKENDYKTKRELIKLMLSKGYQLVGNIDDENYKDFDLKFTKGNQEISFENEVRYNFDLIKNRYETIHIPIRKKNTKASYYVVWKPDLTEFFLINNETIKLYSEKIVNCVCHETGENQPYSEEFLDIPKNKCDFFIKENNKFKKR